MREYNGRYYRNKTTNITSKAKLLRDTIKVKSGGGGIIIWILLAGAVLFGINYLMGGKMFGWALKNKDGYHMVRGLIQ